MPYRAKLFFKMRNAVRHGIEIRHGAHRRITAVRRRRGARCDGFFIKKARLSEMNVHVAKSGKKNDIIRNNGNKRSFAAITSDDSLYSFLYSVIFCFCHKKTLPPPTRLHLKHIPPGTSAERRTFRFQILAASLYRFKNSICIIPAFFLFVKRIDGAFRGFIFLKRFREFRRSGKQKTTRRFTVLLP